MGQITIYLDDATLNALESRAMAQGQDMNQYATAVMLRHVEEQSERQESVLMTTSEIEAALHGPARLFDADAIYKEYADRYGLTPDKARSRDELKARTEEALTRMSLEARAALERDGLL